MNEDKNERSEDLVYISTDDGDGWWESRCNIDDEKEFVIKSDKEYRDAMSELQVLTKHDLGGKNIFPDNFDEKLFSTGKAQYIYIDYKGKKYKCTMVARPVQNLELTLAESFEKTIKSLQKEGLFENVKSFDLDFTGKGINIKLNESESIFSKELLNELKEEWFETCKSAVDHNKRYGEYYSISKNDVAAYFINASLSIDEDKDKYNIRLNLINSNKEISYCTRNNTICKAVVFTCYTRFQYGFDGDFIKTLCDNYGLKAIFDMNNHFNIENNGDIIDEILPIELNSESTIEIIDWNGNCICNDDFYINYYN